MSHISAATVELPTLLSEFQNDIRKTRSSSRLSQRKEKDGDATSSVGEGPSHPLSPGGGGGGGGDVELVSMTSVVSREAGERDPLLLRGKIVSDQDIDGLKHRKGKGKKIAKFYEAQNEHINDLLKPLSTHTAEGVQEAQDMAFKVKLAVNISFFANTALAVVQLYAAISSGSLALFASCVDAIFDPLANLILWLAHRASERAEEKKWPVRGSRFETSDGNIVYGSIMGGVNLILIVESVQQFVSTHDEDTKKFHLPSIIAVCAAFATKFALFLYCYAIKKASSQVQVLWEDHRNDLLTNGFGILTATGGAKLVWWIDPMGACIIATVIILVWTRTIYEQFTFLGGIAAPAEFQNLVTYKAMTFNPEILKVDTCRVYHSGPQYFVEVDIVLDPEMPLWRAHDIAQDLQDQIEALPDVDRCFVHVDHEVSHKPEHRKKL